VMVSEAPRYGPKEKRNFFPMSAIFVFMMMTTAGDAIFRNVVFKRR